MIPILTYHCLDQSGSVVSTPPETFRRQMLLLRDRGYRTATLGEVIKALDAGGPLPQLTAVITFDDGCRSVHAIALPILQELGLTATVFVLPGLPSFEGRALLTAGAVTDLADAGFELGAHTLSHPDLTEVDEATARHEIEASKARLEDHLGRRVGVFAYPYGAYNARTVALVRSRFDGACTTVMGRVGVSSNPHTLNRIDMYYFRSDRAIERLFADGVDTYLAVRQALRNLRRHVLARVAV